MVIVLERTFSHSLMPNERRSTLTFDRTARPKKINFIKDTFPDAKPEQLEIFEMQDLVTADWKPALEGPSIQCCMRLDGTDTPFWIGIDAVIHVATPVYHPWVTGQEIYDVRRIPSSQFPVPTPP